MNDVPMIAFYCGKRVDDMTREELIEAVVNLGTLLRQEQEQTAQWMREDAERMRRRHAGG